MFYYPSRHNYCYKINPKYTFINNNLTGAMDIIDSGIWDYFLTSQFHNISKKIINKLINRGYLYKNCEKEYILLKKLHKSFNKITKNKQKRIVFCPTYYCNLSCVYCFEKDINNEKIKFNLEILNSFFYFIKTIKEKFSSIELYGGEPLLPQNKDIIKKILTFSEEKNLNLSIITNGVYIDKYLELFVGIRKKIEMFQITLDGIKKIHNERRIFRSGKGTFDLIINNISLLINSKINTNIRINIDQNNIFYIPELFKFFSDKGWIKSPNFDAKLAIITNHSSGEKNFNPELILEKLIRIYDENPEIEKYFGFSAFKQLRNITSILSGAKNVAPRFINCEANLLELLIFCPDGYIYACPESIGKKDFAIGKFYPELFYDENKKNIWRTKNILFFKKCLTCKFSLLCGGGCTYSSLITTKGNLPICEKYNEVLDIFFKHRGERILNKLMGI